MANSTLRAKIAKATVNYPDRSQEAVKDPVFVAKLFDIAGSGTWYITEYDPETTIAFGYVT